MEVLGEFYRRGYRFFGCVLDGGGERYQQIVSTTLLPLLVFFILISSCFIFPMPDAKPNRI
jgi:hypothetical protein